MTRIGPNHLSKAALKPPPVPTRGLLKGSVKVEPGKVTEGPKDLVNIASDSRLSSLKQATKNAGDFFLRKALPSVGAAVAGPIGLGVGALVTGTIEFLDRPEQTTSARLRAGLKTAAKTGAVAGVLGLPGLFWAPLAPLLQATAATVGTGTAFGLELSNRKEPNFEVDLPKLSKLYKQKAGAKLKEAGHEGALNKLSSGFGLTKRARDIKAQMRLAQITAVTSHYLGAGTAVALLHDIGRQSVDSEKMTGLIGDPYGNRKKSEQNIDGVKVQRVEGLMKSEQTWGSALYDTVFVDAELPAGGVDAKADFVVGHELSHIKNKDSSATLIQKTVEEALKKASQLTSSSRERELLFEVQNSFSKAELAISRKNEFRADADGMKYALALGHTPDQVAAAAREIFGISDSDDTYQQHPSSAKRIEALKTKSGPQDL